MARPEAPAAWALWWGVRPPAISDRRELVVVDRTRKVTEPRDDGACGLVAHRGDDLDHDAHAVARAVVVVVPRVDDQVALVEARGRRLRRLGLVDRDVGHRGLGCNVAHVVLLRSVLCP
jgi:hypothetical protein